jgi:methionyl-tRNA formyltransferase
MKHKIGFVTCVQLGLSCIEEVYRLGSRLELVITLEDHCAAAKSGRVYLDDVSKNLGFRLIKTVHINEDNLVDEIVRSQIDWLFIIGWSQIAGKRLLESAKMGTLGMHPTLLPEGRGRASIPWAIIKGLSETGVTLFKIDAGVDTGDIICQEKINMDGQITATRLYNKVITSHLKLMERAINMINNDEIRTFKQDESKATYWPQRKPEDGKLDLCGSVYDAERLVRALSRPYPGAFFVDPTTLLRKIVWNGRVLRPDEESIGEVIKFSDGRYLIIEST